MKIVAQEAWNWTLLEDADAHYFSVLCVGMAMFAVEFQLTTVELSRRGHGLRDAASDLAQQVRLNPQEFDQRRLKDFSAREDVRQAGLKWRKERRADAWQSSSLSLGGAHA